MDLEWAFRCGVCQKLVHPDHYNTHAAHCPEAYKTYPERVPLADLPDPVHVEVIKVVAPAPKMKRVVIDERIIEVPRVMC